MDKSELLTELKGQLLEKRMSLDMSECPYTQAEQEAFKEGWGQAFMWAMEIVNNVKIL